MNTLIALVVAVAALPALKESRAEGTRRYDVPGALLVTAGLGAVVWGVTHATQAGWSTMSTWLLLAAGLVLLASFVLVEQRTLHPLPPLRLVLDRDRGGAFLASLLIGRACSA